MSKVPVYPSGATINDRYVLGDKLGTDGSVYVAHDRHLDAQVALKVLHPVGGVAQSWDEAKRLEHLRSRFLVDVINADVITSSDLRFIVTPLLTGGDLESAAASVGIGVRDAVRFAQQIATGVGRIHAAGMVHRDIKPANVLLQGDEILVSDLEMCELLGAAGHASRNGSWCTLAPEVAVDDGLCSIRSDVYSLGATVFYLLSGEYPVDHRLPLAEQKQLIERGAIRDVRHLAPHVPQSVGTVVRRALAFDPNRRFSTAEDLGNALAHAVKGRRNWHRVEHDGHLHCLEGDSFNGKAAIVVCTVSNGRRIDVVTRHPAASGTGAGRRLAGVADSSVTPSGLSSFLQRHIKALA